MRKKNYLLFFYLPLLGIVIIFFVLSNLNQNYIRKKVEHLVKEQLQATAEILKVNISHLLKEDNPANEILGRYSQEENIYYMAMIDENKEILGWSSRFEGYLPLSLEKIEKETSWIIDSPAGKIFNLFSSFSPGGEKTYYLYLGYSLKDLGAMIAHSRRSFFIIFGFIFVIGAIFFIGLYQLQTHYLEKKREAEEEKKEKERYREISAFTSGVAHEIKNPLNSLSLLFELFQKRVPQEYQEDVSLGKKEIQKVTRIINQFTDSLRPLKLNKEKFLLKDLILDVRDSLIKEVSKTGVEIDYSQNVPVALNADKVLMSQSFLNLFKNSLEATDRGKILIQAKQYRKKVFITVKDTGKGIAEEDKEHIFEPFFSKKKKGIGIGLYLTKKTIEAHEGKIEVQSEIEQGTTFFIQMPGG
ncbi:MAG: HAMP domain-containing histidine kinase [Candidatus Aminicenantes bacterium]|nr:MAG: HAMP domain-containing histidine kinase [Candidatus Aminicenantes bacterium]